LRSDEDSQLRDHRDFPRLAVEAKVRIEGISMGSEVHAPAVISDLSLGGARLATPVELQLDQEVRLIPFGGLDPEHPLHKPLVFLVVWQTASDNCQSPNHEWDYYGLRHQGSVLDILESWVGHLLLRRHKSEDLVIQRRQHRRLRFPDSAAQPVRAIITHDRTSCDLTLIDVAPGGLLLRGEASMPVGVHLEFQNGLISGERDERDDPEPIYGCVVDSHVHSGSTFYRVSFDPESEVDEERIVDWALRLGGTFE
jgi:hypothetical protein